MTDTTPETASTFYRPCLNCGSAVDTVEGVEQPHDCAPEEGGDARIAHAFWAGADRALRGQPTSRVTEAGSTPTP